MRVYKTFPDALNEIKRDIAELGMKVHPQTMQDKYVGNDPDYETMEYLNMIYTVTQPNLEDLRAYVQTWDWCEAEFQERLSGLPPSNPEALEAWKLRPEVWKEFALSGQGFGYSYGERYRDQPYRTRGPLRDIIEELRIHPDSRQLFMPVWRRLDNDHLGRIRVPCSLGYWFALRQGKLHITYLQRSGDYFTHLANDLWLTRKLQEHVASEIEAEPGFFTHWIGSLHVYRKDVADVF